MLRGSFCSPVVFRNIPLFSRNIQGMSLSGGEMTEAQERIIAGLKEKYPHTSTHYHVCTDTFGSIATAFDNGTHYLLFQYYALYSVCYE